MKVRLKYMDKVFCKISLMKMNKLFKVKFDYIYGNFG